jgi:endonuclease G
MFSYESGVFGMAKLRGVGLVWGIVLSLSASTGSVWASSQCPSHFYRQKTPVFSNEKLNNKARELCYTTFAVMHSGLTRTPLWVAEHLTKEQLAQAKGLTRVNSFHPDPNVPESERAELADYARSGYDRGHLAPSANMPTEAAQYESFSMANMIPQEPTVNRGIWEAMESTMRQWARQKGEVYIVSGVMFQGEKIQRLNRRVMIPTHVYKAVYDPATKGAAVYVVENKPTSDYTVVSVADLEKLAGVDVFPALSEKILSHFLSKV